jgi:ABC-2 type transport system ATP-binding protein
LKPVIIVKDLKKTFKVPIEEKTFFGKIKSLFFRKYKEVEALKDISFEIKEGEIVGYLGPNGAGKTTTIKILTGFLLPDKGYVEVLEKNPIDNREELLKEIGVLFGSKSTFINILRVKDYLEVLRTAYGLDKEEFSQRIKELSELLELEDLLEKQYRTLSLGQRMKAELLGALIHKPKILFLDEPTIGLDVYTKIKFRELIKKLNKKEKITILITTHDMKDVEELCNRIIVIDKGKKIYDGNLEEFKERYSGFKTVEVVYEKVKNSEIANELRKLAYENDDFKIKFKIKKEEINQLIEKIVSAFVIEDIKINDESLEDIIFKMQKEFREKKDK